MDEQKFYVCEVCGNVAEKLHDTGNELMCCMRTMKELIPGETDGSTDHHIPVCKLKDNNILKVKIGEYPHPMISSHYIQWIEVVTNKGIMRKYFKPDEEPTACFCLQDHEKVLEVYAYCNVHKLWKVTMQFYIDEKRRIDHE